MKKLATPLLALLCLVMIVFLRMGFIFILIALLPSITAFYMDNAPGRPTFKTVFFCNLAAMLPWLVPILIAGVQLKSYDTHTTISNPMVWMVVFGGAAAGWCIIYICSFLSRFFVAAFYEHSAAGLESFQKKLVEEWGEEIIPKDQE